MEFTRVKFKNNPEIDDVNHQNIMISIIFKFGIHGLVEFYLYIHLT